MFGQRAARVAILALVAATAGCAEEACKCLAEPPLRVSLSDAGSGEMWGGISMHAANGAIRCELNANSGAPRVGFGLNLGRECTLLRALLVGAAVHNDQSLFAYTLPDGREIARPFERVTWVGELEGEGALELELGAPVVTLGTSLEGVAPTASAVVWGEFGVSCPAGALYCDEQRRALGLD